MRVHVVHNFSENHHSRYILLCPKPQYSSRFSAYMNGTLFDFTSKVKGIIVFRIAVIKYHVIFSFA